MDADNEAKINQALDHLMKGKTVFVIAHRLNTIQNADQIIVLNDGKIEEMGTHEELMEKKGYYYELVKLQTGVDEQRHSGYSIRFPDKGCDLRRSKSCL